MHQYISQEILKIKEEDRKSFLEDVLEDIKEIDLSRIAGLGVTPDQLKAWIETQKMISPDNHL